ncbi:MAG: hypothetical protein GY696_18710 [Gammaproteobacteria bacterium]|nr:hypothetical protein [Gammaproteobacteria bacterium]
MVKGYLRLVSCQDLKYRSGQYVHECGLVFCQTCKEFHKEGATNECYMKPPMTKKPQDAAKLEEDAAKLQEEAAGDHPMDTVKTLWPICCGI